MIYSIRCKALIITLVLCFFANIISSQTETVYSNKEESAFSFNVGLTATGLYRDTIKYEQGILFNAGFAYTLAFSDKSNIGIEALLTGKAVKTSSPVIKYRFIYIELPVYYQYKFSENIRGNVGIQYSKYMYSQLDSLDGSKKSGSHSVPLATKMDNDIGVLLGVELGLSKNLFIAARYTTSTKSFLENNSPYFGMFQFSFKYVVYTGHKQVLYKSK